MADRPTGNESVIPDFRLPASTGHTLDLDSFLDATPLVLLFLDPHSEDDRELLVELDQRLAEFGSERVQVLVVMALSARDVRQMAEELDLSVPIVADENRAMAREVNAPGSNAEESSPVAIVTDERRMILRRFDSLDDDKPSDIVDILLDAVRGPRAGALTGDDPIGSDQDFYQRVAADARIPEDQAPELVTVILNALVPLLGDDARAVLAELIPSDQELPETAVHRPGDGIEDLLTAALDDSSVASGRPAEHARVVAEALRRRADEAQLRRLESAVSDEDLLSLFEADRGELTVHHSLEGVSALSGKQSDDTSDGSVQD